MLIVLKHNIIIRMCGISGVRFYTQAIMTNDSESKKHLEPLDVSASATLDEFDKWILARLHSTQDIVKKSFETFTSQIAVNELEKFWITGLCDVYLVSIDCIKKV